MAVVSGAPSPKTMCLLGQLQGREICMLVDSGSSHSFISATVAADLQGVLPMSSALSVQVANGNKLVCSTHIPQATWYAGEYQFQSDLRCFQLQHMI